MLPALIIIANGMPSNPHECQFYLDGAQIFPRSFDLGLTHNGFPLARFEVECSVTTKSPGESPPPNPLERTIERVVAEGLDEGYLNPDTEPTGFNALLSGWQANVYRNAYAAGQLKRRREQTEKAAAMAQEAEGACRRAGMKDTADTIAGWTLTVTNRNQIEAFKQGLADSHTPAHGTRTYNTAEVQEAYNAGRICGELSRRTEGTAAPAATVPFSNDLFAGEPLERLEAPVYQMPDGRTISCGLLDGEGRGFGFVFTRAMPDGRTSELKFALTLESTVVLFTILSRYFVAQGPSVRIDTAVAEEAWGIIANASGGDWTKQSREWVTAAERWRDNYMPAVAAVAAARAKGDIVTPEMQAAARAGGAAFAAAIKPEVKKARREWNHEDRPICPHKGVKCECTPDIIIRRGEYDGSFGKHCPPPAGMAPEWEHTLYAAGHDTGNRKFRHEIIAAGKAYWLMHPGARDALFDIGRLKTGPGPGGLHWYHYEGAPVVTDVQYPRENAPRLCYGIAASRPTFTEHKTADGKPLL